MKYEVKQSRFDREWVVEAFNADGDGESTWLRFQVQRPKHVRLNTPRGKIIKTGNRLQSDGVTMGDGVSWIFSF